MDLNNNHMNEFTDEYSIGNIVNDYDDAVAIEFDRDIEDDDIVDVDIDIN